MPIELAWLIPGLPLLSFVLLTFVTRRWHRLSGYVSILLTGIAFVLALWAFWTNIVVNHGQELSSTVTWLSVGSFAPEIGVTLVPLSSIMIVVVTGVSLLVQIYSQGYMAGDPGYPRYYSYLSLFTFSMLGLVLGNNLLQIFIFWEGVGVCSYLLIGYWWTKPEAAMAAKKAFITTRIGDLGFLFGILLLWATAGTLDINELTAAAVAGTLGGAALSWALVGLFLGAVGKSAQFPLHVWLPDAMEGPTPVSALIHAATMVAAGVFLVARTFDMYLAATEPALFGLTPLQLVAWVGGFTALFAATMGLVMNDIKKVMAYSTVSQLGYMMLALGVGGLVAGMFHLFTHAFFKALLFLGSGSVIHGTGTQDMREMGGLRRYMPWTFLTVGIGSLALAGIPPFAGFFSKDEILAHALHSHNEGLFAIGLIAAFMTAFYVTRLMVMTFMGQYRGALASHGPGAMHVDEQLHSADESADAHHADAHGHGGHGGGHGLPHESPPVMLIPLLILAVMSVVAGFFNWPNHLFAEWLGQHGEPIDPVVAGISTGVALAGIFVGLCIYQWEIITPKQMGALFGPIYTLVARKYYIDEIYEWLLDKFVISVSVVLAAFDRNVIDGIVNLVGNIASYFGAILRRVQTGQVQFYALVSFAGLAIIVAYYWIVGTGAFTR